MFNKKSAEVAVLGAGPSGLIAAHILADRKTDFVLFDRAESSHRHSYALALHPETLELLDRLGVVESVLKQSLLLKRVALFDECHSQRAVIDYSQLATKYPCLAVIGQNKLEAVLVKTLAEKGHKPKWHHRVRCIEQGPSGLHFTVDRLGEGMTGYAVAHMEREIDKIFEYDVDYLIAADGHASLAREAAGIGFPEITAGLNYAVFELKTNTKPLTEMRLMLDGEKAHIYWPLGQERCRFSFQMPDGFAPKHTFEKGGWQESTLSSDDSEMSNTHLDHLLYEHAPWFIGSSKDVRWRAKVRFEKHMAESFGSGRIWLVGDAAHLACSKLPNWQRDSAHLIPRRNVN
jgi:2-polyprenyl-6-methoxyphenol hydroxylase-like FAD-dependent oxidoreductase